MALSKSELRVGETHSQVVVENLSRTQIVQYAGASGDYNPVHTDEVFATQVAGYPTVFAHGMLTMGLTATMITDYVGDGRLAYYGVRFTSQVWPGDTLTATATVESFGDGEGRGDGDGEPVVTFKVSTTNQDGREVLSGAATALIDP
jgi:acyl dehydratase